MAQIQVKHLQILTEVLWIIFLVAIAFIGAGFLFRLWVSENGLDLYFSETYYMSNQWIIILPVSQMLIFTVFFLKALQNKFRDSIRNTISVISGLSLIICLAVISIQLLKLGISFSGGWTSYPPLSAVPVQKLNLKLNQHPAIQTLSYLLTFIQMGITGSLLLLTYSWGTRKHRNHKY